MFESPRVVYVTAKLPELDAQIRAGLEALGVGFEETQIGHFTVFYELERHVRPEELRLQPLGN